jgi:hypothetical protein
MPKKLTGYTDRWTDTVGYTDRQQDDLISLLLFLSKYGSRLKIERETEE